ncbi:unnamed protein product [Rhizoctonia solani]|uniref:O-methylsterigmatocystin oxidoreductase n=1 Tax=Rhizoctonia solani TaxID=456999 RepID=A0A8H3E681_9AGAM|nr:unnamed protein product [Rhizoctonia solani]
MTAYAYIYPREEAYCLTVASSLLAYKLYKDTHGDQLSLPPSPRSYPLIGHLLSIPTEFEHLGFMRLGEQLESKIFSLTAFGTTIIVLNDRDDAVNLFDKRSGLYSDRTNTTVVQEPSLLDWPDLASLIAYGDRWRRFRRLMNPLLTKQSVAAHQKFQEQDATKLLQRLLKGYKDIHTSHEVETELVLSVSATMFRSLYGYEVASSSDPLAIRTQKLAAYLTYAAINSNYLVNLVPALRHLPDWFPGTGWKQEASKWRKEKETLIDELYRIGLENMKKDETAHIMVAEMRSQALRLGLTEKQADEDVKQVAVTLIGGSIETTGNTLMMFFLAMLLYPEVQKKAQNELDSVIRNGRLPTFEDRAELGYIERIIQEILRWRPVTALAIPHTCFEDDTYKGYHIPKGTILAGNVWAMTRDETVYKDPEVFDPDRFLDPSTPPSPVFGWGRRVPGSRCPGSHLAQSSLFITIASILMTFNIEAARDKDGNDIRPSGKLVNSLVLTPEQFPLKLTPRSAKHEELIEQTY